MSYVCYVAPMEGITGYVFRRIYREMFVDDCPQAAPEKYYMPFMSPQTDGSVKSRDKMEYAPEHNIGIHAVPQILTNRAESFLIAARKMQALGYEEVNLNVGCPYPTVVSKRKGSGMLAYPDQLNALLDQIFHERDLPRISVKTRLSPEEGTQGNDELSAIYARYPISELIVHPRRQKDFYRGRPDEAAFARMVKQLGGEQMKLCYNGNLYTPQDMQRIDETYPEVNAVMIGRGLIRNPALLRAAAGGKALCVEEFYQFHRSLYHAYREVLSGPSAVLGHMKELWMYWETNLTSSPRAMKTIYKARKCEEYEAACEILFQQMQLLAPDEAPRVTAKLSL